MGAGERMSNSSRRLLSLLDNPLDLARIESGEVELRIEPVVAQEIVKTVVAALRPLAERKGLRFYARVPRDPVVISSDRRLVNRILLNLADNAIKFTEAGDVVIVLEHVHAEHHAFVEFRVVDTGIGITAVDQTRLFASIPRQSASGLGLHVSQRHAALLGGRITCNSEHGQGSTFSLILGEERDRSVAFI
jgi:protein-histidine pros-kinase